MSDYVGLIRHAVDNYYEEYGSAEDEAAASAALDELVKIIQKQEDRIAYLEGDIAGWRIKLSECQEENQKLREGKK